MEKAYSIPQYLELATSGQSRDADQQTIGQFGIDGFTLMEVAASKAASFIQNNQKNAKRGFFLCGKGNNAGDALAAARYLADQQGHQITVFMVLGEAGLSPEANKNLSLLKKLVTHGTHISFSETFPEEISGSYDYIVDGLFGTGLNSNLREPIPQQLEAINQSDCRIYAIDIPSGLNADTGHIHGGCVKAHYTLTFGTNKLGFYLNHGKQCTGEVVFLSLPFPRYLQQKKALLINQDLHKTLPGIRRNAKHKYDNGVVHVIAGSEGLTGAAVMAAQSAWKQGAGAVILYAPGKLLPVYETLLPQIIKVKVGKDDDTFFKYNHIKKILDNLSKKPGVLLAGPGIGTAEETGNFLSEILSKFTGQAVLDADALFFWENLEKLTSDKKNWLLTPHPGEAKKYLSANFNDDFQRLNWACEFTEKHGCTLLSKGNPAILAAPQQQIYITEYDTSVFARAGFGDVLAGTIACNTGINSEFIHSAIFALIKGFNLYQQSDPAKVFGPEHLL